MLNDDEKGDCVELFFLVYDLELRAPACVLLQAAHGCGARPAPLRHFEPRHWLTKPTPGMRKIGGTDEEWQRAAALTLERWGGRRAAAPSRRAP